MSRFMFAFAAVALSLASTLHAGDLRDHLLFYEDGEDLKSPYEGVKISPSIAVVPGRFGNALRIERRTLNAAVNGDFELTSMDPWILPANAQRQEQGGVKNSAAVRLAPGDPLALPMLELKPTRPHAFSFYVKRADAHAAASVTVHVADAKGDKTLVDAQAVADDYQRVELVIWPATDSATVRISASAPVLIDNVQLDAGIGYFNSFVPPLKKRNVDRIELPPGDKYLKPASGAFACWIKVPWLTNKAFSDDGQTLLTVQNAPQRIAKWGDHQVLFINAWTKRKMDDPKDKGMLHAVAIDESTRVVANNSLLEEIADTADGWHHLVVCWNHAEGQMTVETWLDGGASYTSTTKPFGPLKPITELSIGGGGGSYLNGLLDDLAIFDRPLSADEIKTLYSSGKPLSQLTEKP